jgi:hypothetical protein
MFGGNLASWLCFRRDSCPRAVRSVFIPTVQRHGVATRKVNCSI